MAHALHGYKGKCAHIHGHSYQLSVTVLGQPVETENDPKLGMVMDFGELKGIVNDLVVSKLDHALLLSHRSKENISGSNSLFNRVIYVEYQPTCENMLLDIADTLKAELPETIELISLKLTETPTSYAEWHAEDNR